MVTSIVTHRYVSTPLGELHLTEGRSADRLGAPLVCLHATAYSGQIFLPLIRALDRRLRVIAPDTPGYGGSEPPPEAWPVETYAEALIAGLDALGEEQVDLFGYHTGAFMALEMALQAPRRVRRLILVGVPFYEGEAREERRRTLAAPMRLVDRLDQFEERWNFLVRRRPQGISLARGFHNFVDELRAWPQGWWAHEAAFTYRAEAAFPRVRQPVLILNPRNHLSEPSRAAARLLPNASLVELPHLSDGVLEVAAKELAVHAADFLASPDPLVGAQRSMTTLEPRGACS